jgi:acyl-CoA reductase-like NAD-dependent aldehyde dehydrogenase
MKIKTFNPYTEDELNEYTMTGRPAIEDKLVEARKAQETWRDVELDQRMKLFKKLARRILTKKSGLASTITDEMGKPVKEAQAEVEKCSILCSYYARHLKSFLKPEEIEMENGKAIVQLEPIGIVGAIMPWNFPMWQAFRFAVPAIAAGNAVMVKTSSITIKSGGIQINDLFLKSKFPENLYQTVIGDATTGIALAESKIDALSFTGSLEAGEKVAYTAIKDLKKLVLELGGSDPFIVLDDADVEKAAKAAVVSRFVNAGQNCIAAKRIIITKKVSKEFIEKFVEGVKQLKWGNPANEETDIGPLPREDMRKHLEEKVAAAKEAGVRILLDGGRPEGEVRGYFFRPMVITDVKGDMPIMQEELFGPVAPIMVVETESEAFNAANDSKYGLGASIWTKGDRGKEVVKKVSSGIVYVNDMVRSDPRLPFGGIKKSGFGRELSWFGIHEMTRAKTIVISK